jgi:hypothetical protein
MALSKKRYGWGDFIALTILKLDQSKQVTFLSYLAHIYEHFICFKLIGTIT